MAFDPYLDWLEIPAERRPPNEWDLLGLTEGPLELEVLRNAADDRIEVVRRYANSPQAEVSEAALRIQGELSRALLALEKVAVAAPKPEKPTKPARRVLKAKPLATATPVQTPASLPIERKEEQGTLVPESRPDAGWKAASLAILGQLDRLLARWAGPEHPQRLTALRLAAAAIALLPLGLLAWLVLAGREPAFEDEAKANRVVKGEELATGQWTQVAFYDFSDPVQLADFDSRGGGWRVENGQLIGDAGHQPLVWRPRVECDVAIVWDQTIQQASTPEGMTFTSVSLTEDINSVPTAAAEAIADRGYGQGGERYRNSLVLRIRRDSSEGRATLNYAQSTQTGHAIAYDQPMSLRLEVRNTADGPRTVLTGMGWELRAEKLAGQPAQLILAANNCAARFDNLRIWCRPSGDESADDSPPATPAVAAEKPVKPDVGAGFPVTARDLPPAGAAAASPSPAAVAAAGPQDSAPPAPPLAVAPFDERQAKEHQQAWAAYLNMPLELTNSIDMTLVLIPPGEFTMGSPVTEPGHMQDEGPQHQARITRPFYLAAYEVTQGEYQRVMGANPSYFSASGSGSRDVAGKNTNMLPVEQITWEDAVAFCRRLSESSGEVAAKRAYRLPTEAEWEYACRAGTTTAFPWGASASADRACFSKSAPVAVGSFSSNAFGLWDMPGNVWEWCLDWFADYASSTVEDPTGASSGTSGVTRGGGYATGEVLCRSANRNRIAHSSKSKIRGFRVACTIASDKLPVVAPRPVTVATAVAPPDTSRTGTTALSQSASPGTEGSRQPTSFPARFPAEVTPEWAPGDAGLAKEIAARRQQALQASSQQSWGDLVRSAFGFSLDGPSRGPSVPFPTRTPKTAVTVPDRFILQGELDAVRVYGGRAVIYLGERVQDPVPQRVSYSSPAYMFHRAAIEFASPDMALWMADYRKGDKIRVAVRRQAFQGSRTSSPGYVPSSMRSAMGLLQAEFRQVRSSSFTYSSPPCWTFQGEGIEKIGHAETWIDPQRGRAARLANRDAVTKTVGFALRNPTSAAGNESVLRGKLEGLSRVGSSVRLRFVVAGTVEGDFPCLVGFDSAVELREFLDYLVGGEVEVLGRVLGDFLPSSSSSSSLSFSHSSSRSVGGPRPPMRSSSSGTAPSEDPMLPGWPGLRIEPHRVRMAGKAETEVSSIGPRRSTPPYAAITPEVAYALGAVQLAGRPVEWEGTIEDIRRCGGETHLLLKPAQNLFNLRYFEAVTRNGDFLDDLGDYQGRRATGKDGGTVIVSGLIALDESAQYRFAQGIPMIDIQSIERRDSASSRVVVGQRRAKAPPSRYRDGKLQAILRDLPPAGTTVTFVAHFGDYYERESRLRLRADDDSSQYVYVLLPNSKKKDFETYKYGVHVEVTAVVPAPSKDLSDTLKLEGKTFKKTAK